MKLYIPAVGDAIVLTNDWEFNLTDEYRNKTLHDFLFGPPKDNTNGNGYDCRRHTLDVKAAVLPKGTALTVEMVYIRKGNSDYNSITFVVKKAPFYKKGKLRFWVKLKDSNEIEFEPYTP